MSSRLSPSHQPSASPTDAAMLAAEVKALLDTGCRDEAADRFGELVVLWQRRALRLAVLYLGNAAEADDAVQDAFVKLYTHMTSYRSDLSFDAWFTRIIVNACHDRARVRSRAHRWLVSLTAAAGDAVPLDTWRSHAPSPEHRMVVATEWTRLWAAVRELPSRQRQVFLLCHLDEQAPRHVAETLGMSPATVRVHLFRAMRALRRVLGSPA